MNAEEIVFVGVKSRVIAIKKSDGRQLWSTTLPGGLGDSFVTLLIESPHVFAHTRGQLHCLDFKTGRLLWTNELAGCGYGIASIAVTGHAGAPNAAVMEAINAEKRRSSD